MQEAVRLVGAVAVDEGRAFLHREGQFDLLRDPLVDIDGAVIEQRRGRCRHGVKLHRREAQRVQRRRRCLRARVGLTDPAGGGPRGHERLLVDIARDGAHRCERADRRDRRQPLADALFEFDRYQIAAVGVGSARHRLGLQVPQDTRLAAAHIGLERALVLARRRIAGDAAAAFERRTGVLQRQFIHALVLRIERGVDAIDLFLQQHIAALLLEPRQALVIGRLEFLEGDAEVVIVAADGDAGFVFQRGVGDIEVHSHSPRWWLVSRLCRPRLARDTALERFRAGHVLGLDPRDGYRFARRKRVTTRIWSPVPISSERKWL